MLDFIMLYGYSIISTLILIVILGVLWYRGKSPQVKKAVMALVLTAEQRWGPDGSGAQKYAYVIGTIYQRLPLIVRLFITEPKLEELIKEAIATMWNMYMSTDETKVVDEGI